MALQQGIVGSRHTGQQVTWTRTDGTPQDLTGATLTGTIREVSSGVSRAIAGALTVSPTNPAGGIFTWGYAAADLVAGVYEVQFIATYADTLADKTEPESWTVIGFP